MQKNSQYLFIWDKADLEMIVGLIGRTNVGKSTLFNKLLGTFRAIVTDIPGTTRELLREEAVIQGQTVTLVDSPWLDSFAQEIPFLQEIIDTADILLFVIDGKWWLTQQDEQIKEMILRANKKSCTILVANKMDSKVYSKTITTALSDYYALWFDTVMPISAFQDHGIDELRDEVNLLAQKRKIPVKKFVHKKEDEKKSLPLAIVGRPNVGKSTLLNRLTGEQFAAVEDTPGTTLDYVRASFTFAWIEFDLYDTAWIRKKGKTSGIEKIAYEKTISMVKHVRPLVVLVIDLDEWLTQRDKTLLGEFIDIGVPIVIAVNKIDLVQPDKADRAIKQIRHNVGVERIPLVKISGKEWLGLPWLLEEVIKVWKWSHKRISTPSLNKSINQARIKNPPRFPKNKICKIKYSAQVETSPPVFAFSVNKEEYANFAFKKRIENIIRGTYGFHGVPLFLKFNSKSSQNPYAKEEK